MQVEPKAAHVETQGDVAVVTFGGEHANNTFPTAKMNALARTFAELSEDDAVRAVVITAGPERSFGVGGDFNEVHTFSGGEEVAEWIRACIAMYRAAIEIDRPVVAAVEGYAIGIGLQLALCADYRVGAPTADLRMPEFKLGIACVLGAYLLERRVGPAVTRRMIMSCRPWNAEESLRDGLLDDVAEPGQTIARAVELAAELGTYEPIPFRETKRFVNAQLFADIEVAQAAGIQAHQRGFSSSSSAQSRMRTVIGNS
jgi:enoyl-CoA hydratase/carnithine racemase